MARPDSDPSEADLRRLWHEFSRDFAAHATLPVQFEMTFAEAWSLMVACQIASHHPEFRGRMRMMAEAGARQLQKVLALTPALESMSNFGWDPEPPDLPGFGSIGVLRWRSP